MCQAKPPLSRVAASRSRLACVASRLLPVPTFCIGPHALAQRVQAGHKRCYQVLTMVARIARLFGQTLPTDISVAVETALDLKARLACLGAIGVGTKAALLLRESRRHRDGNYGHHEYEHFSPPDFESPPVIV
jgi:hypothetical protein